MAEDNGTQLVALVSDEQANRYVDLLRQDLPQIIWRTATTRDELLAKLPECDILVSLGAWIDPAAIALAPKLKWIQGLASGTDHYLRALTQRPDVRLTSMRGYHSRPVAEHALMLMLALARHFPAAQRAQDKQIWSVPLPDLLAEKHVAIAGIGTIGRAIAERCRAFEMRTTGFGSVMRKEPSVDAYATYNDMAQHLGDVDYLVIVSPATPQTRGLFDKTIFRAMKPGSHVVNVGRGLTLVTQDLIDCLNSGHIASAALDVLAEEPLPPGSPLWTIPNLIITPHSAGNHSRYVDVAAGVVRHNMMAFLDQDFARMRNVVL